MAAVASPLSAPVGPSERELGDFPLPVTWGRGFLIPGGVQTGLEGFLGKENLCMVFQRILSDLELIWLQDSQQKCVAIAKFARLGWENRTHFRDYQSISPLGLMGGNCRPYPWPHSHRAREACVIKRR